LVTAHRFLQAHQFTMYINELIREFLNKNQHHKSPDVNIEILNKFWLFDNVWTNQHIVPPLLIYADLFEILSKMSSIAEQYNISFFVVGTTSRDIYFTSAKLMPK
jgi:hypothetical protein